MNRMKALFAEMGKAWSLFWFESNRPYQWALFRTVYATMLLVFYLIRTLDLKFLFSEDGILPVRFLPDFISMKHRFSLLVSWPSDGLLYSLNALLLASLCFLALGIWPRLAALVAYICHVSFVFRNPIAVYGADLISTFFLLYMIFADTRDSGVTPSKPTVSQMVSSVALRLAQFQLCIIYAYSGLEKLRGTHWWTGEAIWDILANFQLARYDFGWVSHFPLIITVMSLATVLWEIYFPAVVWLKPLRLPVLIFGVFLHVGIGVTMNIFFFGLAMILVYTLFLNDREARTVASVLKLSKLIEKKTHSSTQVVS